MAGVLSDIVQYRARSVISRYLHQRAEPKVTQPPVNSSGVQQRQSDDNDVSVSDSSFSTTIESLAAPATESGNEQSTRTRFPPLPDDYDIHSFDVFGLLITLASFCFRVSWN